MRKLWMVTAAAVVFGSSSLGHEICFVNPDPDKECKRICLSEETELLSSAVQLLTDRGANVAEATEIRVYHCSTSHRIYFYFCKQGEFPLVLVVEREHGAASPFLWDSE